MKDAVDSRLQAIGDEAGFYAVVRDITLLFPNLGMHSVEENGEL